MTEAQQTQMATLLGVMVGAALDLGLTPSEITKVFSRKNVLSTVEIVLARDLHKAMKGKP